MIHVGISPAGCTWNVWPKSHESADQIAHRVTVTTEHLACLWAKHNSRTVRVRRLTPAQVDLMESLLTVELGMALTWGRTIIEGPREILLDAADMIEHTERGELEERVSENVYRDCTPAQLEQLVKFGVDQQMASLATAVRRIRGACA